MLQIEIDAEQVRLCRAAAYSISQKTFEWIDKYTTVGIERAVLRLLGIEGTTNDKLQIPLVNIFTDLLLKEGMLGNGAGPYLLFLENYFQVSSSVWLNELYQSRTQLPPLDNIDLAYWQHMASVRATDNLKWIRSQRQFREKAIAQYGERPTPWLYVIVATGNIYEDIEQAELAVRQGADIIAVIRSTAQSLLDYIPEHAPNTGVAGTYANRENFRLMRERLDKLGQEMGRYIRLTNYASGLCMAEMAVLGGQERIDMMLSDSLYGILFRDINMVRTLTDQHFARAVQAFSGIIINTGEDNYLTTTEQHEAAHTVLASQFINQQFAHLSGLPDAQIGLGHAFEMNTNIEDGLLLSIADALLSRACFPDCPLKYMPPTKHIDGNIFFAHVINSLFNLTSIGTSQHIHLVGVLSEAIHTPFLHERFLAIQNAKYVFNYAKHFSQEFILAPNSIIQSRSNEVLDKTYELLKIIECEGLASTIEKGLLAGVARSRQSGKGLEGVILKTQMYQNPVLKGIKAYE